MKIADVIWVNIIAAVVVAVDTIVGRDTSLGVVVTAAISFRILMVLREERR